MTTEITRQTILIVEDEISLRNALRDKFTREGFLVFDAKDGEIGLAVAIREQPQLILLDLMMPKMDGMTMLHKLRSENEWGKSVPVILLTNLGADDKMIMKEIEEDTSAYYLVKSNWSMDQMVDKVKETIALSL
ncbi:response regulator [Patescibacteria group bacterium]|nr:MAG: response regulator [Patescibacteria group bacterium]